jgi:hydrogenase expression/formation protein HypC
MCLAVPGQVKTLYQSNGTLMGVVCFGGVEKEVCFAFLPNIQIGDYTIVHVGFAISQIDEGAAKETLDTFAALGLLDQELKELRGEEWSAPNTASADCDIRSSSTQGWPEKILDGEMSP